MANNPNRNYDPYNRYYPQDPYSIPQSYIPTVYDQSMPLNIQNSQEFLHRQYYPSVPHMPTMPTMPTMPNMPIHPRQIVYTQMGYPTQPYMPQYYMPSIGIPRESTYPMQPRYYMSQAAQPLVVRPPQPSVQMMSYLPNYRNHHHMLPQPIHNHNKLTSNIAISDSEDQSKNINRFMKMKKEEDNEVIAKQIDNKSYKQQTKNTQSNSKKITKEKSCQLEVIEDQEIYKDKIHTQKNQPNSNIDKNPFIIQKRQPNKQIRKKQEDKKTKKIYKIKEDSFSERAKKTKLINEDNQVQHENNKTHKSTENQNKQNDKQTKKNNHKTQNKRERSKQEVVLKNLRNIESHGKIRIGKEFQSTIPKFISNHIGNSSVILDYYVWRDHKKKNLQERRIAAITF